MTPRERWAVLATLAGLVVCINVAWWWAYHDLGTLTDTCMEIAGQQNEALQSCDDQLEGYADCLTRCPPTYQARKVPS